jgi:hypothetical protein
VKGYFFELIGSTGFFGITKIGRIFAFGFGSSKLFKEWLLLLPDKIQNLKYISVAHGEFISENAVNRIKEASSLI